LCAGSCQTPLKRTLRTRPPRCPHVARNGAYAKSAGGFAWDGERLLAAHTVKSDIAIRLASRISDSAIYHVDLHAGSLLLVEILGK